MTVENLYWLSAGFLLSTAAYTIFTIGFLGPKIRRKEERIWAIVDGYKELLDGHISRKPNLEELKERMGEYFVELKYRMEDLK